MATFKRPVSGQEASIRDWPELPDRLSVCLVTMHGELLTRLQGDLAPTGIRLRGFEVDAPVDRWLAEIQRLKPGVLLLDVSSFRGRLAALLQILNEEAPDLPVILLWRKRSDLDVETVIGCRVAGCQHIDSAPALHAMAIRAVTAGEQWLPRWLEQRMLKHLVAQSPCKSAAVSALTPREHEVHDLAASGLSNKQIARRLAISEDTVKKHLKRVFAKLGIHRRIELALMNHSTH